MLFVCAICAKIFESDAKNAKYCRKHQGTYKYYKPEPIRQKTCKQCGKPFQTRRSDKLFCATTCLRKFHYTGVIKNKVCLQCRKPFTTTNSLREYCSEECRLITKRARDLINLRRGKKAK